MENYYDSPSGYPVFGPRFELRTFWIPNSSINHCAVKVFCCELLNAAKGKSCRPKVSQKMSLNCEHNDR